MWDKERVRLEGKGQTRVGVGTSVSVWIGVSPPPDYIFLRNVFSRAVEGFERLRNAWADGVKVGLTHCNPRRTPSEEVGT